MSGSDLSYSPGQTFLVSFLTGSWGSQPSNVFDALLSLKTVILVQPDQINNRKMLNTVLLPYGYILENVSEACIPIHL